MKKLSPLSLQRSWSILLHPVSGASRSLFVSGLSILASGFSKAQPQPLTQEELNSQLHLQAQPRFQRLTTGEKVFSWIGQSGFSYFVQASPDLLDWTWAPNIEPGVDAPMSYEVDGPTGAGFFRLVRTDQTAADLDAADFDGDGLSNNFELTPRPRPGGIIGFSGLSPNIQTHPLRADTDGDGLSDKWELENGFDPTDNGTRLIDNGPNGDPDNDGVTNLNEQRLGTKPKGNANSTDSDEDGTLDFEDAVPGDNLISWKRTPESSYALIEIETQSIYPAPEALNNRGEVLFPDGIWAGGTWIPRQAAPLSSVDPDENPYNATVGNWSAFNADRKLIGSAHLTFTDGPAAGGAGIGSPAFWVNDQSSPSLIIETANLWDNQHSTFTPIAVSDNGDIVLRARRMNGVQRMERYDPSGALIAQMDGNEGFHPSGDWSHADSTGTGWVASNLTRAAGNGQPAAHKVGLWDAFNYPIALPAQAEGWGYPVRTKDLPNGKVVLTAGASTTGRVFLPNPTGQYEYATKLTDKNIELFAGDGSALTSDGKLWRNGDLIPMIDLCSRYKELLEAGNTIQPLRSNKDGTYLVQIQSPTATSSSALLVPVKVEWKALNGFDNIDDHEDPWTHARIGKRIFPDYKDPNDTEIRHKLELIVTVSPAMAGQSVFVKAFDVDDSTNEASVKYPNSSMPDVDSNGPAGGDNILDFLSTPQSGQFWTGSSWGGDTANVVVATNGEAKFIFRVGMQPGNNYRVVTSLLNNLGYSGAQTTNPTTAKYLGPAATQNAGTYVSPLLTVWRRLWVENDSMEAIPVDSYGYKKNNLTCEFPSDAVTSVDLAPSGVDTLFTTHLISDKSSSTELENGRFIIQSTSHPVTGTEIKHGNGLNDLKFSVKVAGDFTSVPVASEFRLYDDDDFGLSSPPLPLLNLADNFMKSLFKPAFIEAVDSGAFNSRKTVTFKPNDSLQPVTVVNTSKDLTEKNGIWICQITAAYQFTQESDSDPDSEEGTAGGTTIYNNNEHSTVFVETCREAFDRSFRLVSDGVLTQAEVEDDFRKYIQIIAVHEICHQPGNLSEEAEHGEGGIMQNGGGSPSNPEKEVLYSKTISRLRSNQNWSKK